MPGTRAQSKSRGGAGATSVLTVGNSRQALKNLIEEGDLKLTLFHNKNGELVEKLEALILTASGNTDLLARTTSLRDKVVGESDPYRNCFKRLMAEHETLLA